jgi:hypothetical protein
MANLPNDLKEFIGLFNSAKVDYLIVGGHAVAFHGYPRLTGDFDFWIRPTFENAERVARVLSTFGFPDLESEASVFTQPEQIIQLGRPPNRIDILTSASGLDFEQAWRNRVAGHLDSLPVFFLDKEALLKNKRASGRLKDLADVDELTKLD